MVFLRRKDITTTLFSVMNIVSFYLFFLFKGISSLDPEKLRSDLEHQLAEWSNMDRGTAEEQQVAQEAWRKYELLTSSLSQELCEQLRLVLEPSLATKLRYVKSNKSVLPLFAEAAKMSNNILREIKVKFFTTKLAYCQTERWGNERKSLLVRTFI